MLAEDLPPFDEDAACSMCGATCIDVVFHARAVFEFACSSETVLGKHLCRICQRCNYRWCEAPLDTMKHQIEVGTGGHRDRA